MTTSPNKGFIYLVDGDENNEENLSKSLRILDATTQIILESVTVTDTPDEPQPGQAWFVANGSTLTGDWAALFGSPATSDQILFWGFTDYQEQTYGWTSVPVPTAAFGYIIDQEGRFNFSGGTWTPQVKIQQLDSTRQWGASLPVANSGTSAAFILMTAPFDLDVLSCVMTHEGTRSSPLSDSGCILPRIAYSLDPSANFNTWTELVTEGPTQANGGWNGTTIGDCTTLAYGNGLPVVATEPLFSTTIPRGATIAFGEWATTDPLGSDPDNYSSQNSTDIGFTTITIEYTEA